MATRSWSEANLQAKRRAQALAHKQPPPPDPASLFKTAVAKVSFGADSRKEAVAELQQLTELVERHELSVPEAQIQRLRGSLQADPAVWGAEVNSALERLKRAAGLERVQKRADQLVKDEAAAQQKAEADGDAMQRMLTARRARQQAGHTAEATQAMALSLDQELKAAEVHIAMLRSRLAEVRTKNQDARRLEGLYRAEEERLVKEIDPAAALPRATPVVRTSPGLSLGTHVIQTFPAVAGPGQVLYRPPFGTGSSPPMPMVYKAGGVQAWSSAVVEAGADPSPKRTKRSRLQPAASSRAQPAAKRVRGSASLPMEPRAPALGLALPRNDVAPPRPGAVGRLAQQVVASPRKMFLAAVQALGSLTGRKQPDEPQG